MFLILHQTIGSELTLINSDTIARIIRFQKGSRILFKKEIVPTIEGDDEQYLLSTTVEESVELIYTQLDADS